MSTKIVSGDIAYIVESIRFIREVEIIKVTGEFCLVRFTDGSGGIKVRESRIFPTGKEAQQMLPRRGFRPWHPD